MIPFLNWFLVIFWMGLIFYLSSNPLSAFPPLLPDWLVHLFLYSVLAFLLWRALNRSGSGTLSLLTIVLTVLYGFSDEIHQIFVPTRTFNFKDLAFDTLAASVTVALIHYFLASKRVRKN